MLKQRIITAVIAAPLIVLAFIYCPPQWLVLLFVVFVVLGTREMAKMLGDRLEALMGAGGGSHPHMVWVSTAAVVLAVLMFLGATMTTAGLAVLPFGIMVCILLGCFLAPDNDVAFGRLVTLVISVCYGVFPWLAIWELYEMGPNGRYVILLMVVVFMGDTGAYFGGSFFGKRKLAPRMSPKKTMEGAVAGLLASLLGACLMNLMYGFTLGAWHVLILAGLAGGAFGQMGDLVESTFKRFAGVKDSGKIFPGHGGFLDRVDGIYFAAPVIWAVLFAFGVP